MIKNISIIIIANCDADTLRNNLPHVLAQQYMSDFEVIVVRETKKGELADTITLLSNEYKNLSSTYLPDVPQYISYTDVAIMLGTKAAKHEDIVIINPSFIPDSELWLNDLSGILNDILTVGKVTYTSKFSFLDKYEHRKEMRKILKRWCKQNNIDTKSVKLNKNQRQLLSIAYKRSLYLSDPDLRQFISKHELNE